MVEKQGGRGPNMKPSSTLHVESTAINPSDPTRGLQFALSVDSENKATEFRLFSLAAPHMLSFHLSWFSFFACFVSTFAAPPLLPIIRDNLGLTATDIGFNGFVGILGSRIPSKPLFPIRYLHLRGRPVFESVPQP